jgi:hypothetical protein
MPEVTIMSIAVMENKGVWDRFVDDSPYGTIFHRWDFLKIVETHTGYRLLPYGIYRGSELVSVFPLFFRKEKGMKMLFSPPPRTGIPYLGFVMGPAYDGLKQRRKEGYANDLADEVSMEIKKLSPNYVSISTVPGFGDVRSFKWNEFNVDVNFTYLVDLRRPQEQIWAGFSDDCKRNIKACKKYDLVLRQAGDADTFYRIMVERYRQQGLNYPIVGVKYLQDVLEAFPGNVKMYFLYHREEVVGIEITTQYKDKLTCWMGAASVQREIPSNYHIRWELIKMAREMGFKYLELSGANKRQLCLNKSTFNPRLAYWFQISRKDALGRIAELAYARLVKRKPALA